MDGAHAFPSYLFRSPEVNFPHSVQRKAIFLSSDCALSSVHAGT